MTLKYSTHTRNRAGNTIAEFAPTLLLLFVFFSFPMIAFGTIGMRYMFLLNASRLAASSASQCKSFLINFSSSQPSSVNLANQVATQSVKGFNGVTMNTVTTQIAICPLAGSTVTRQSTALAKPADTTVNSYNIEVLITGTISPLVQMPKSFFGTVPGLTAPITTSAKSSVYAENPQGLNQ
jgi:hypothetical protein